MDTKPRDVFCAGCGSLMPLRGPLPVAAYCQDCAGRACPCAASRPAWHQGGGPGVT